MTRPARIQMILRRLYLKFGRRDPDMTKADHKRWRKMLGLPK